MTQRLFRAVALILAACAADPAAMADSPPITHIQKAESPIAGMVIVPPGATTYYVSGMTGGMPGTAGRTGAAPDYGDTKAQTIAALTRIKDALAERKLGLGDVVSMRVYLVGDPAKDGKMDFAGMMEGYRQFFGTPDQPNKPARTTVQVSALAAPGLMVEIEVVAAR